MGIHYCGWCGNMSGGGFHDDIEKSEDPKYSKYDHGVCIDEFDATVQELLVLVPKEKRRKATKHFARLINAVWDCE